MARLSHTDAILEAVIGAVEELAQSSRTITLVQDTFETNFFSNVNIIKAVLPTMRERKNGHIIMLTGISKNFQASVSIHGLTQSSWPSWDTRSGHVLFISMGH